MERSPNTIETEATDWVIRLDAGSLAPEAQREFDQWVASDRRRHGAFVRARAAWLDTDRMMALESSPARMRESFVIPTKARIQSRKRMLLAASVAALALVASAIWLFPLSKSQVYASEIGEVRNIELADGSKLTLNTNTRATVRFEDAQRDIALDQGEALFKVAHDASRPFVVHANDVQIRAIGTAFTVRVDDTRTDVLVTEGTVEVSREGVSGLKDVRRVTANQRVMLASSESRSDIEPVGSATMARALAWRDGMAAFAGEPLGTAVAEINRHSRHPIYVDDPALAARPVVGIFNANDSERFASAAAATFGARIEHVNGEIHLRAAAPP